MFAQKRKDSDEGGGGRGDFQVRVICGGREAPAGGGGGGGLEIGLRIGSGQARDPARALPAGDPVHRLEVADGSGPLAARPMSEAGPAVPRISRGGRQRRRGLAHWTGWMAVASCGVAVAAVAGLLVSGRSGSPHVGSGPDYVFEQEEALDDEQEYFLVNSGELAGEAEALLERYAAVTSVEQALAMVRGAARVRARMERLWQPWGPGARFAGGEEIQNFIMQGAGRPAICLTGRKGDFSRFELVFVREGERLKLDWEASHGIGEVQIADLQGAVPAPGGVVRAVIRPATFHPAEFPEERFRSYQLSDAGGEHFVWAFTPRGSVIATALKQEFNEGSVLLESRGETRATVRLAGSGNPGLKCFEITEMLHKGWVTP
jgi:hypothetical protein